MRERVEWVEARRVGLVIAVGSKCRGCRRAGLADGIGRPVTAATADRGIADAGTIAVSKQLSSKSRQGTGCSCRG